MHVDNSVNRVLGLIQISVTIDVKEVIYHQVVVRKVYCVMDILFIDM